MVSGRTVSRLPRLKGLEVLVPLNQGGMGEVWLAKRKGAHGFQRLVALKVIRGDLAKDDAIRNMFLDEARVLSHLDHPAVAQVLDFGEQASNLYLALEYVPGLSLSRLLKRRRGPVPAPVAARMIAEVARGLHAVHGQTDDSDRPLEIVHRDISPQNIMISFDGRMKLLDFGIALVNERLAPETSTGFVKGKIAYVAPEQITGVDVDRRTDVYSLCIVLHELLTGAALFAHRTSPLAAAEDRKRPPRPSRTVRIPGRLEKVVMRGLRMDPNRRWQSARDLAVELEAFATRAGGPTLEAFAERELAQDRGAHKMWIRSLAQTETVGPPPAELAEEVDIEIGSSVIEAQALDEAATPSGGRRWLALAAAVLLALGAAGWAMGLPQALTGGAPSASSSVAGTEGSGEEAVPLEPAASTADERAPAAAPSQTLEATPDGENEAALEADGKPETDGTSEGGEPTDEDHGAEEAPEVAAATSEAGEAPQEESTSDEKTTPEPEAPSEGPVASEDRLAPETGSKPEAPATAADATSSDGETTGAAPTEDVERTGSVAPKRAELPTRRQAESSRTQGKWGRLTLRARPGGWILVDGQVFGRTPLIDARIRAGRHKVALRRPGDDAPRWSSWVNVRDGRHVRLDLR